MPSILGANTLSSGGYDVANSLRFNSGSSDSLTLSTTAGNRTTWTFSTWFKRSKLSVLQSILEHDDSNYFRVRITSGDVFEVFDSNSAILYPSASVTVLLLLKLGDLVLLRMIFALLSIELVDVLNLLLKN